ncbi:hypothetical protein IQ272_06320 [Chroococcidiopsidales cyanobacterium LEGE 13417]|nr:hypothetical protein [Chroococcidiopsidales cyanobacterium LEGE 13417]
MNTSNNLQCSKQQNNPENNEKEQLLQHAAIDSRKDGYGENFQDHLLEEYKIYVEMMDRTSARRVQTNTFYLTLLSAILALVTTFIDKAFFPINQLFLLSLLAILGLSLCFVWMVNINSYKELNSLKFKVINEMEKHLPYPCYMREWEILKEDTKKHRKHRRLTQVEKYVPFILAVPYFLLFFYSTIKIFTKYFTNV